MMQITRLMMKLKPCAKMFLPDGMRKKMGETNTGRVLPSDYLWFSGDGKHNYFRNAYKGGETWDWSLPSPYET